MVMIPTPSQSTFLAFSSREANQLSIAVDNGTLGLDALHVVATPCPLGKQSPRLLGVALMGNHTRRLRLVATT